MAEIMVVDDDQDLCESTAAVLAEAGFGVTLATRGQEALGRLQQGKLDLILLDLVMPGLSGLDLLGRIREKSPRLPVIMITAFASIENAVAAMRRGAADYLIKPCRVDVLLTAVRRALEESRFQAGQTELDIDKIMGCLANSIRRGILACLGQKGPLRFMDLCRQLAIEDHTKMNFHLKILKEAGFLTRDEHKLYRLSEHGLQVMDCTSFLVRKLSA